MLQDRDVEKSMSLIEKENPRIDLVKGLEKLKPIDCIVSFVKHDVDTNFNGKTDV